jgi:hypothetical protein
LRFSEAPKLIVVQSELLVALGDTTVMECKTSGVPPPQVKWFKGTFLQYVHVLFTWFCFLFLKK